MSIATTAFQSRRKPVTLQPSSVSGLLQRRCACGAPTSSLTGECEECKSKGRLQAKLTIGASDDPLEQEADRIADQVVAAGTDSSVGYVPPRIQRYTGQASGRRDTAPPSVDRVLVRPGSPLEPALRQDMEGRFGHDFSRVRVHTDARAMESARDVKARAYTVGQSIVFGPDQFSPGTNEGRHLLLHELAHVVQQTGAPVIHVGQGGKKGGQSPTSSINYTLHKQDDKTSTNLEKDKPDNSRFSLQLVQPDFLSLRKPFLERNAYHLWDPNSALEVWKYNWHFFKRLGLSEDWAAKAANLTAPVAIDTQLKAENPNWWEITDRELRTSSIMGLIPLFRF